MMTHALVKVPTKEAEITPPKPVTVHSAPSTPAPSQVARPASSSVVPDPVSNRSLTNPLRKSYAPESVREVGATQAAQTAHPVGSFVARHMPNLSGRSGAGLGAAIGAGLGALSPGKDDEGDERSAIGGAIRGGLTGAALGGVAGAAGRRALINPMMRSMGTNAGAKEEILKNRANSVAAGTSGANQTLSDAHLGSLLGMHPSSLRDEHRAIGQQFTKDRAADPKAVMNLVGAHEVGSPEHLASLRRGIAAPVNDQHTQWMHENVVQHMTPDQLSHAEQQLQMPAEAPSLAYRMGRGVRGLADAARGIAQSAVNRSSSGGTAPTPNTPPATTAVSTNTTPAPQVPADDSAKRLWVANALARYSQHGLHTEAGTAVPANVRANVLPHGDIAQHFAAQHAAATAPSALPSIDDINAAGQNIDGMLKRPAKAPAAQRGQVVPIRTLDGRGNEVIGHHRYAGSDTTGQHYIHGQGASAGRLLPINENQIVQLQ